MIRRRVVVAGQVQGVWFRDRCRTEARAHGVSGWVRNRADGCVEAVFEGDALRVDAMVRWCRQGPPRAIVTGIEVHDEPPIGERGFRVR